MLSVSRAVIQRHAPGEYYFVAAPEACSLVGVEAEVQQQREDLRPVMARRDSQQPARILDAIDQLLDQEVNIT